MQGVVSWPHSLAPGAAAPEDRGAGKLLKTIPPADSSYRSWECRSRPGRVLRLLSGPVEGLTFIGQRPPAGQRTADDSAEWAVVALRTQRRLKDNMLREPRVPLFEMTACLTKAVDLVSRALVDHQNRVAYIASSLGAEIGLPLCERNDLLLAGILHDTGGLSLEERLEAIVFDHDSRTLSRHCNQGYLLFGRFEPFREAANLIRYHHTRWDEQHDLADRGVVVPFGSHVLHLADRVAVLLTDQEEALGRARDIVERIQLNKGGMFCPDLVEAFSSLAGKEYFWLEATSRSISAILSQRVPATQVELDLDGVLNLAKLFAEIVDFRSPFTATHSMGVAAVAAEIARRFGFSDRECRLMEAAGYLHDLGKLAVPASVLDKPGQLTEKERNIIRVHSFYTFQVLKPMEQLATLAEWAAFHHERMDGTGYPFHLSGVELPLGARIMAVADVFTALAEDRPYREGLSGEDALKIVRRLAEDGGLDPGVVDMLGLSYEYLDAIRANVQGTASREYREFGGE